MLTQVKGSAAALWHSAGAVAFGLLLLAAGLRISILLLTQQVNAMNATEKNEGKTQAIKDKDLSKVDPLDEDFEHVLRRAAREKEKKRAKNLSLYR